MTLRADPAEIVAASTSPQLAAAPWWVRVRLGDIAEVINGAAFKSSRFNNEGRGEPLVRIRDVGKNSVQAHYDGPYEEQHLVNHGDLLVGMDGDFRVATWEGPRALLNQRVCRIQIREPDYYSDRFLLHVLQPYLNAIQAATSSITVKHLSSRTIQDLPIPLPPRAEQERIVAAIEERLSRLDAGEFSLSSARRRLVTLEQRRLDEVIEGQPIPLQRLLREPLRNGLSASASPNGAIRVVTLTAVTKSQFIDAHTKMIDPGDRSFDDLWMEPGDVFVQRSNTPELVGTSALYDGPGEWAIFPDLLIRVRVDPDLLSPSYLELVLQSTPLRRYFQRSSQGIAGSMPKISQPIVEAAQIPLPSKERQLAIVRRLIEQRTVVLRVSAEIAQTLARASSLRRAVLAAAFSGRLAAQDPNDEPASVLLERIRAKRASASPAKRRQKATTS